MIRRLDLSASTRQFAPMDQANLDLVKQHVRDIHDFPKPGIVFKDITPVLADPTALKASIDLFTEEATRYQPTKILGIDARGFLFGAAVAYQMGIGFVPVRKQGKLPYESVHTSYTLEYGEATIEMHVDAIQKEERIVLIDDLLATGGTAKAAADLVNQLGGHLMASLFLIELDFLEGRKKLAPVAVQSFLHVD